MSERLINELESYIPFNGQEERDRWTILHLLRTNHDLFERSNLTCHMTASAWVVNYDRTKVLMAYHRLYDSWAWLGGHADGNQNLLRVALKEVKEESGITEVSPVSPGIYSIEILTVDGHEKRGTYVPSHLHLNITYLMEADDRQELRIKEDENSAVAWFSLEEALERSTEPWFVERIYKKLNEKLKYVK